MAPVLAFLAHAQMPTAFAALLIPVMLSDVIDGWLARKLAAESTLGATLDSIADILLAVAIMYAIWALHPYVFQQHGAVLIGLAAWLALGHVGSLLRYGRLASFHTHLIRAGIFAASIFVLTLFLYDFVPWGLYLAAAICALGGLEHFVMLALIREWKPNIYGGIAEALRMRREGRQQRHLARQLKIPARTILRSSPDTGLASKSISPGNTPDPR